MIIDLDVPIKDEVSAQGISKTEESQDVNEKTHLLGIDSLLGSSEQDQSFREWFASNRVQYLVELVKNSSNDGTVLTVLSNVKIKDPVNKVVRGFFEELPSAYPDEISRLRELIDMDFEEKSICEKILLIVDIIDGKAKPLDYQELLEKQFSIDEVERTESSAQAQKQVRFNTTNYAVHVPAVKTTLQEGKPMLGIGPIELAGLRQARDIFKERTSQ